MTELGGDTTPGNGEDSEIVTREDLAEQAVDDLEEIESLEPERAATLIMAARAHWFENEQQA